MKPAKLADKIQRIAAQRTAEYFNRNKPYWKAILLSDPAEYHARYVKRFGFERRKAGNSLA